ncbi:MAG TPA: 2-phospho-L-lactate guanylyltransferase [Acidimicrobiia bacterium]|nr:2-phospho-L-lactate guanylyltransferase [Acidimicrobiia bacterium]
MSDTAVVVPIRAFALGKARLAARLDVGAREQLARTMAEQVVRAAAGAPVVVVSSAIEVRDWAETLGVAVVDDPGTLDDAARAGCAWARGASRICVVHADLPYARSLDVLTRDAGNPVATIVPCHRDDGTPALSLPGDAAERFRFAYGPGSARRHIAAARAVGLAVRVVRDPLLAFDVDVPDDLAVLAARA